jgi:hypothetical protein
MSTATATSAAAAPAAPAAGAATGYKDRMAAIGTGFAGNWKVIVSFAIGISLLAGNIGLLSKLAGSSDSWDTIKTQMGGSIALSFIGATFFTIALWVYFASYNVSMPIYILVALANIGIAVGLSAMSVAAMTR